MDMFKIGQRVKCYEDNWTGKIRRLDGETEMALIEWTWCGSLPTDICTWVSFDEVKTISPVRK